MPEQDFPNRILDSNGNEFCRTKEISGYAAIHFECAAAEAEDWMRAIQDRLAHDPDFRAKVALYLTLGDPHILPRYLPGEAYNGAASQLEYFTDIKPFPGLHRKTLPPPRDGQSEVWMLYTSIRATDMRKRLEETCPDLFPESKAT